MIRHFVIVAIVVAVGLFILWINLMNYTSSDDSNLRVGFPGYVNVDAYDPTKIHFSDEYILLESIYSPLIELSDDKGTPISCLAEKYYWEGNDLHLVIRDDVQTIDGHTIGVKDVAFSLKRLLILSNNTHGDFKNLICPDIELKSIDEDCPRIVIEGEKIILKLTEKWDYLIPMLAAIDFAIIPKGSVDLQTLKIVDYRNTSGPYFVEKDHGEGNIVLRANPHHFHFDKKMAQEIVLVPSRERGKGSAIERYNKGEFDHITTAESISFESIKEIDQVGLQVHETIYIGMGIAYITDRGRKRISLDKRKAFVKSLQKSFREHYRNREGYRTPRQFFLTVENPLITKEDEYLLDKLFEGISMEEFGKGIQVGVVKLRSNTLQEYRKIVQKYMPELQMELLYGVPAFGKVADKDMPDYVISFVDSGFLEDIGLLSYTINAGFFGMSQAEGKAWLKDYMNTQDRKVRLGKIREMQLKSLEEGLMVPLFSTPYLAVAREPWRMHLSSLFANNPFWKIRRD